MKTKEEKKISYMQWEAEHFKKAAERSKKWNKEKKKIKEDLDEDPIKEIYKDPSTNNNEKSKDPIDFVIEERMKKDIPYKNEEAMEKWDKRDVLNRMIQIVINTDQFKHHISEEFYYLYHSLSTNDIRLFEIWLNNYNCYLNKK